MRNILTILISVLFLAVALATGAVLLIAIAAMATVFVFYILIRQKLTGKPFAFTRFHTYTHSKTYEEKPNPLGVQIIEAEYEEIEGDKR